MIVLCIIACSAAKSRESKFYSADENINGLKDEIADREDSGNYYEDLDDLKKPAESPSDISDSGFSEINPLSNSKAQGNSGSDSANAAFADEQDDPLENLYRRAITLDNQSRPLITVQLMSFQNSVAIRGSYGDLLIHLRSREGVQKEAIRIKQGRSLEISFGNHESGEKRRYPVVADLPAGHSFFEAIHDEIDLWTKRGYEVRIENAGGIFGFGGRIIDNRRVLVLLDGPGTSGWAAKEAESASRFLPQTPVLHEIRIGYPSADLSVVTSDGDPVGVGFSHLSIEGYGGVPVEVENVEYGVGYAWHGKENRKYDGIIHVVAGDRGLTVINEIPLETLLRGVVPAETYASAPEEALKAQAVTARTDILAKVGARHLADPALVCAETHCQVYKGRGAAVNSTDRAVEITAGEVLVDSQGRLVNAVYSAMCGGHTEDNEVVWGTPPDPALRGRLDFPAEGDWFRFAAGIGSKDVRDWISKNPPSWCRLASMGAVSRHRWTRRFSAEEMDLMVEHLEIGSVRRIEITGRGVSGRVMGVKIIGTKRSLTIRRELPVRRLLGNLESGMFVVEVETGESGRPTAFVFRGGGWGHGVGMCQTGAIGMAEHGYDYTAILRHYYNGAETVSLY